MLHSKKKRTLLFVGMIVILLVSAGFLLYQALHKGSENHSLSAADFETHGPYVGYIRDSDAERIDIYTTPGGDYVTSVSTRAISNFLGQGDVSYRASQKIVADFYCGRQGNMAWIYIVSKPAFHSSMVNLYTVFRNDEETEQYNFNITDGGVVTGAVFASKKVGFVGLRVPDERGFAIYATVDSGASWQLVATDPPRAWENFDSLIPVTKDSAMEDGVYPFILDKASEKQVVYITTEDSGRTWHWTE